MATRTERNDGPINEPDYLSLHKGKDTWTRIKGWLLTLDHKRIGVMYLASILAAFFVGGIIALLVRTELLFDGPHHHDVDTYNQVFTLHGASWCSSSSSRASRAALGNFFLPIMLGAKDVAFPKLNLASASTSTASARCSSSSASSSATSTPAGRSTRRTARARTTRSSG
jgi:cytochrome c oxidase subunit 1